MNSGTTNKKSGTAQYVLHKLGEALYIRDKRRQQANKAGAAVSYLKEQGVLQ